MEKKCTICNKKFEADNCRSLYCSNSCKYKAYYLRKKEPIIKECVVCSKTFEAIKSTKKYCSQECADKSEYQREKNKFKQICECCGNEYYTSKKTAKFCSISCSNKSRELEKDRAIHEHVCECCGNAFKSIQKNTRFCSTSCNYKSLKNAYSKIMIKYKCGECEKEYELPKTYSPTRFCSNSCARKNMHKNMSIEQKESIGQKISEANTGREFSEERKEKYRNMFSGEGNPRYGCDFKHTKETKEKLSNIVTLKHLNGEFNYDKGKVFSNKMSKDMYFHSSWEKTVIEFLDKNDEVVYFDREPFSIKYLHENIQKNYIPDFIVIYKNGSKKIIEVKPKCFVEYDINLSKFSAAKFYCQEKGFDFEVWTEETLSNLTFL